MRILFLMSLFLIGCSHNQQQKAKEVDLYFSLVKFDQENYHGASVAQKRESYPFKENQLTLKDGKAQCEIDISGLNQMVANNEPLGLGLSLKDSQTKIFGQGELVPGKGNGVLQVGIAKSYRCRVSLKKID